MRPDLTIIIPAKHEAYSIIATLESLRKNVRTKHRIIVVNVSDKSDKTADKVTTYIKSHPHVELIREIHQHGTFGMALIRGFDAVKTGVVVPVMADLCDDPKTIDRMYNTLVKGWDMVAASRYMKGGRKIGGPKIQSLFSYFVCKTLQWITRVPTDDISNALKMYRAETIKKITIDPSGGVEASMEIALQAYFNGARITQIPTTWTGRSIGFSKFKFLERFPRYLSVCLWAIKESLQF